ncbi:MAG TPA: hypothetical protein VGN16_05410 [Acidobacteriaceae bacterium]|jgi:hypothetical protein
MIHRVFLVAILLISPAAMWGQSPAAVQEGPISTRSNPDVSTHPRTPDDSTLSNDSIIRMTKAGLSEQIIAQAIDLQPGRYDTNAESLIALKEAGVSDKIIGLMQSHGTGLGRHDTKPVELAPLSGEIDEMGVYYQDRKTSEWIPLKTEKVVIKSGGFIKSTITQGIIKQDRNGTVNGEHSPLVLNSGTPILIYAPEGTSPDEYTFVQFREHGNRREFRIYTGGVIHGGGGSDRDSIDFTAKKIAKRMYTFNVPEDVVVGEYGILPPGAAAGAASLNGNGKMFTFRVAEAHASAKP